MVPEVLHFHLVRDEPPPADATGPPRALRRVRPPLFRRRRLCAHRRGARAQPGREFERGGVATFLRKGRLPKDDDTRRARRRPTGPTAGSAIGRPRRRRRALRWPRRPRRRRPVASTAGRAGGRLREPTRAYLRARRGEGSTTTSCRARASAAAAPALRGPCAADDGADDGGARHRSRRRAGPRHPPPRRRAPRRRRVGRVARLPGRSAGDGRAAALPSTLSASAPFSSTTLTAGRCPTAASRWATRRRRLASVRELASRAAALVVKEAAVAGGEAALFLGARLPLHGRTYVVYEAEERRSRTWRRAPTASPPPTPPPSPPSARVGERRAASRRPSPWRLARAPSPPRRRRRRARPTRRRRTTRCARAAPHSTVPPSAAPPRARRSPPTSRRPSLSRRCATPAPRRGSADVTAFRAFAAAPPAARPPAGAAPGARANAEPALDPALFLRALELASEVEDPRHSRELRRALLGGASRRRRAAVVRVGRAARRGLIKIRTQHRASTVR